MDEGAVEPLHVVAVRKGEQHLIGQDGQGQQEDGTHGNGEREGAQPKPGGGDKGKRSREAVNYQGGTNISMLKQVYKTGDYL